MLLLEKEKKVQKINQQAWDDWVKVQGTDEYGLATFRYAERWADLIEIKMNEGCQLEDVSKQTCHDADTEGITGFMYGIAVSILAQMWVHGDRLRRWHNWDVSPGQATQANREGKTLNPALIGISR